MKPGSRSCAASFGSGELVRHTSLLYFLHPTRVSKNANRPQSIIEWPITDLWFSYYKDLRGHIREDSTPGRLKMGYGPGGPPVIGIPQLLELLRHVVMLGMTNHSDIAAVLPPPSSGAP